MGIVSPLLPLYIRDMGATGIWLGIIIAAYSVSNSLVVPIAGKISDQKGRKGLLAIGLLVYSVLSLGYVWAGTVTHLALIRFLQGIAGAMTGPIATAYVGDLSPEGEEGKWMGYANAAFFSGFGFGPFLGGVIAEHFGIPATFYTMGAFNLLALLVTVAYLPEVKRRKGTEDSPHPSFKEISRSGTVKGIFSLWLGQAIGRGAIFTFLPVFAAMMGLSISLIGILITVNILSVTLLTPLGGIIADRFNRKPLAFVGLILFAVSLAAIPLTHSFWPLLAVLLIQGVTMAISQPAASALGVEEGRRYGMGSTMSVLFLGFSIGMAVGPIIAGAIAQLLDVNAVFYIAAGLGAVGSILFVGFTKHSPS